MVMSLSALISPHLDLGESGAVDSSLDKNIIQEFEGRVIAILSMCYSQLLEGPAANNV